MKRALSLLCLCLLQQPRHAPADGQAADGLHPGGAAVEERRGEPAGTQDALTLGWAMRRSPRRRFWAWPGFGIRGQNHELVGWAKFTDSDGKAPSVHSLSANEVFTFSGLAVGGRTSTSRVRSATR